MRPHDEHRQEDEVAEPDAPAGVEPKAYWYLSRSSAIVAYILLWISMVLGLAITNKLALSLIHI